MPDIFISYSRENIEQAQLFYHLFQNEGYSVWWDRDLVPGDSFRSAIRKKLNESRSVVVLWTKHSVKSDWVPVECTLADEAGKLVPVFLEDVEPPLPFNERQGAQLQDWQGDPANSEFQKLLRSLKLKTNLSPSSVQKDTSEKRESACQETSGSHEQEEGSNFRSNEEEAVSVRFSEANGETPVFWKKYSKWLASVGGLVLAAYMALSQLAGDIVNAEYFWNKFKKPPEVVLDYEPKGKVYADTEIHLQYQAPPYGHISLWNQEFADGPVIKLIPEEGGGTEKLSKAFNHEPLLIMPTNSNGSERYILLWTSDEYPIHLPMRRYSSAEVFELALEPLKGQSDVVIKELNIPIFQRKK